MSFEKLDIKLVEASPKRTQYFVYLGCSNKLLGMVSCRNKKWFASNSEKEHESRKEATRTLVEGEQNAERH